MQMYQPHPFLQDKQPLFGLLPPQDIPLKKKNETWWKECVDSLEVIARNQYWAKLGFSKNYRLANGEFLPEDYSEKSEPDFDVLSYLSEKSEFPFAKNYDIISQPLNTLLGELDTMPDEFDVIGRGDIFENEANQVRMQMLNEWFLMKIEESIRTALLDQGVDLDVPPETEEEQQQLEELIERQRSILSPPEIEKYMKTSYRNVVELWGQYEMKDQQDRFKLRHKRFIEFYHFLVVAERSRHLYYDGKELKVESLNPKHTFSHKNPSDEYIQDGNLAGFIEILSIPAIIDKYGHELSENDYEELNGTWDRKFDPKQFPRTIGGKKVDYLDPHGRPYHTKMLTDDPYINQYFPKMKDMSTGLHTFIDDIEMSKIDGLGESFPQGLNEMCIVITGYWKSIERIGKLTWINPETGLFEIRQVDENFIIPDYIKVDKSKTPDEAGDLNTIIWGRVTKIYQGKKICNYFSDSSTGSLRKPIYFSMREADIQIGKLPIGGQFANNINTVPTSFVDRVKNLQFLHNVLINQAMHQLMTDILPFVVAETNTLPDGKDWGEDSLSKWLTLGHEIGVAPVDTSPGNNGGGSAGNTFPKVIDLDRTQRILARFNLAAVVRQLAWESVGITPQRMGSIRASETATGVNEAVNRSYSQTGPWFTEFFDCEREILQMQLDAAKYLQSNDMEHSASFIKSDFTKQSIKITADLSLYDLHMYVVNTREHARNLDFAKRMAIENNTSDMPASERLKLGTESSLRDIMVSLKDYEDKMIERQQEEQRQMMELEQQKIDADKQMYEDKKQMFYDKLMNDLRVATIRALGFQESDINNNNISDVIEQANLFMKEFELTGKQNIEQGKLDLQRQIEQNKISSAQLNLQNEREKRAHEKELQREDFKLERLKLKRDKVRGDKSK